MIDIIKINWLSQEGKEAEVYLFDDNFNIICFSHPLNKKIGDEITLPLYALNAKKIYRVNGEKRFLVEKGASDFGYKLSGEVIDKSKNQVKIGKFIIELDISLPSDIEVNNYVSFICDRIDLY